MTLGEVIRALDSMDPTATIYAVEPWTSESGAVVAHNEVECNAALQQGLMDFMSVGMAQEFLDGWTQNVATPPTLEDRCARLIHYARFDA